MMTKTFFPIILAIFSTLLAQPVSGFFGGLFPFQWDGCEIDDCPKCLAFPSLCDCNFTLVYDACCQEVTEPLPDRRLSSLPVNATCPEGSIGTYGDPHFKTWSAEKYDFHGVCDLVLLTKENLNIHVRTQKTRRWSYIHSASIQIGDDILEVMGGSDKTNFWINKVPGDSTSDIQVSNYHVDFTQFNKKSRQFVIDMGETEGKITIKTWNDMVKVSMTYGTAFEDSHGLMGRYPDGLKLSRSLEAAIDDYDAFGMEWQVQNSEPQLFHTPSNVLGSCEIPSKSELRRRLGESEISQEDAEVACARVSGDDFDMCVFDVMATNEKESAGAY